MRYSIVVGNPFTNYHHTTVYTSLKVHSVHETLEEVEKHLDDAWDKSGGLLVVIDLKTGLPAKELYSEASLKNL